MNKNLQRSKKRNMGRLYLIWTIFSVLMMLPSSSYGGKFFQQQITEKKITIKVKLKFINEIFVEIMHKSGLNFVVTSRVVQAIGKRSINVKNSSVKDVLNILLAETGYTYYIKNNYAVIKKIGTTIAGNGKNISVSANVVDGVTNEPLVGATVFIVGSKGKGAISNNVGRFVLAAPIGSILQVSYMGMVTQNIEVVDEKPLRIGLNKDIASIDDVVVTGFGNVKKSSWTGNSTTVTRDEILKVSRTNVIQALQVFDPSFRIKENSRWGSDPNAVPEINIRGESGVVLKGVGGDSFSKSNLKDNPNLPTFMMDGFEVDVTKLYDMDINRIASITILKDAAATALYGSRAANGVVVITTIMPKGDELIINYSFTGSVEAPDLSAYNLANAAEKLEIELISGSFESSPEEYYEKLSLVNKGVDTYWLSQPLKVAFNQNHSVSIDGGAGVLRYNLNFNFSDSDGVMKGSFRQNYGASLNLSYKLNNLLIRNQISYAVTKSEETKYGAFSEYSKALPYNEFKDENGKYLQYLTYGSSDGFSVNPLYESTLGNFDRSDFDDITNNLTAEYKFPLGFRLSAGLGLSKNMNTGEKFIDPLSAKNINKIQYSGSAGELFYNAGNGLRVSFNSYLTYYKNLGKHDINGRLGVDINTSNNNTLSIIYEGFPSGDLSSPNYAQDVRTKPSKSTDISRSIGFLGAVNYSYNNIYLLDASFRFDGSSAFGDNSRFAPFWSVGVGMNIHNYEIFEGSSVVSLLKVRGTYGSTGKINFPPHASKTTYTIFTDDWYNTGHGATLTAMGNPDLEWETTNTFDCGIEIGLFNSRIYASASYYNRKTLGLLTDVTIPLYSGFPTYKDNIGEILNQGVELSLRVVALNKKDWRLNITANLANNKNTILKISDQLKAYNEEVQKYQDKDDDSGRVVSIPFPQYVEGGSSSSIWGMKSSGINPSTGEEIFKLPNGGYTDVWQSVNQVILGDSEPIAQGSISFALTYKGLTLSTSFMYQFGGDEYNQTLVNRVENVYIPNENVDKRVLTERWKKSGDISQFKKLTDSQTIHSTQPTSRFVQEKNTLSGTGISLSYDLPNRITDKLRLSRVGFEVGTNDIFYLSTVGQERGLDFPYSRTFDFSVRIAF